MELLRDFSRSEVWAYTLLFQFRTNNPTGKTYLQWCESGWAGKFSFANGLEIEDLATHLYDAAKTLLFDQRACKGLVSNRWFLRRLAFFLTTKLSESVGIRVKRRRKRGHTDHGSLPSTTGLDADREGAESEYRGKLGYQLICWLKSLFPP
jgi:hypothetical protein